MTKVCVLLNGSIKHDNRVIKIINTLSQKCRVDLFYIRGDSEDKSLFNLNVKLFPIEYPYSLRLKIIQHSFFWHEFNFFINQVLDTNVKYHVIWSNDLPTLYPATEIAKKLNANLIYDSHEIYLETLNQFFPVKSSFFKSFLFKLSLSFMKNYGRKIERKLVRKAHHIITVNESLANYFSHKYDVNNVSIVMNCPPLIKLNPDDFVDYRKLFSFKQNDKVIIYQGVLNKGRGLELLIRSFNHISLQIKLIILGNGPLKNELKNITSDLNLDNQIKFLDRVPVEELLNYTSGADIGINLLEDYNLSKKLASPNKLFEYIHAGIPVICSKTIENEKVMKKYTIGIMVENNINNISNKINQFVKEDFSHYKLGCKNASLEYNWGCQEQIINNIVN